MSVFMRDRTHTYLMLTRADYSGRFLTIDRGLVEVVVLPLVDDKFWVGSEELVPYAYDFLKAVEKYSTSTLQKTPEALAEIMALLEGRPVVIHQPEPAAPAKVQKQASSGGYSLADLCKEAGIDPGEARKKLRQAKVEKPGARWDWPNAAAAASVLAVLKS